MHFNKIILALAAAGFATGAYATNGMNLEGYGPIATGMGGASYAYDNGVAAVMNNPATLGLMPQGDRLDAAVGFLGPNVDTTCTVCAMGSPITAESGGDAYIMPAVGWARKNGALTYGVGMFAQGGMGTEYAASTFLGGFDGMPMRSELGVGRLIAPLAYEVNPNLVVAGSLDFVWAMLDLKMALDAATFGSLVTGGNIMLPAFSVGRVEFSDDSDFTGKSKGYGLAGKIGFIYKVSPTVSIGGTYHSETSLSDMETSSSGAAIILDGGTTATVPGKITVRDFQWPATYGLGVAVQATPKLMVAADVKQIAWSDVMQQFSMTFSPGAGAYVDFALPQNWDDQTVFSLGAAYRATDALTLRAGANIANNPVPDSTLNFLFPAMVENHYTIGFGYGFNKASELNFSLSYAPEVTQTNPNMFGPGVPGVVEHSQTSWQLMYSHKF